MIVGRLGRAGRKSPILVFLGRVISTLQGKGANHPVTRGQVVAGSLLSKVADMGFSMAVTNLEGPGRVVKWTCFSF